MMTKLFLKVSKNLILSSIFLLSAFSVKAQMECRSTLGAHLTPFYKDVPILWAVEGTMAPGVMTDFKNPETRISGGMLLGALDITFLKKNNLYFEGGFKNWSNSALPTSPNDHSRKRGMRQAYYTFTGNTTVFKLGLHEMKLGEYFLIDERILGASLDQDIGAFTVRARIGTGMQNFARMGHFCANRHLYSIIDSSASSYTENIGKKPGETNLFGFTLNWNPAYVKTSDSSDDEFSEFDEFSDAETKEPFVSNVGMVFYSEFGSIIPNPKLYFGSLIDINLPYQITLRTGSVYQNMPNNNAIVYLANFSRNFSWNSGANTNISAAYYGKYNINKGAIFQPLFSNLFLGEIMRLDAVDFPLWYVKIKHNFSGKLKFHIALKSVGQIYDNKTFEVDLESGFKLVNHVKITSIFSRVQTVPLPNNVYMARLEVRVAF